MLSVLFYLYAVEILETIYGVVVITCIFLHLLGSGSGTGSYTSWQCSMSWGVGSCNIITT